MDVIIENAAGDRREGRMMSQWLHNDGGMAWRYCVVRIPMDAHDADDIDEMLDDMQSQERAKKRPPKCPRGSGLAKRPW